MNQLCRGCNVLEHDKPVHCALDDRFLDEADILFLSGSLKYDYSLFTTNSFSDREKELLLQPLRKFQGLKVEFSSAVKCPSVAPGDMTPESREICRQHLRNTVSKVKPKLIIPCGNFALLMLLKKSGIEEKRGCHFLYEQEDHSCHVVPIRHPWEVYLEPKHKHTFFSDIVNAINKYLFNLRKTEFEYEFINSDEDLYKLRVFEETHRPIAIDTETEGLDFKFDKVHTIALSDGQKTFVVPIDHKDSGISDRNRLLSILKAICSNPRNRKVLQNCKFDMKMLFRYGIEITNVWDTKTMYHLIDEDAPKSLKDLVKRFYPETLEDL